MHAKILIPVFLLVAGSAMAQGDFKVTPNQVTTAPQTDTATPKPKRTTPSGGAATVCPRNTPNCKN